MLITGIVRNHDLETWSGLNQFASFIDRENTPIVRQRVDNDHRILPGFNHFIEIADCASANGTRERTVLPYGSVVAYQKAAYEIRRGQIIVAGYDDEGTLQAPGHVLDKTRFSTARRPFQHDGEVAPMALRKNAYLIAEREVIRLFGLRVRHVLARIF
jgi:hypothetical protein